MYKMLDNNFERKQLYYLPITEVLQYCYSDIIIYNYNNPI